MQDKDLYLKCLGKHLKEKRKEKGISGYEIEMNTSVNRQTISKLENGIKSVDVFTLHKIIRALGMSYGEFFREFDF